MCESETARPVQGVNVCETARPVHGLNVSVIAKPLRCQALL